MIQTPDYWLIKCQACGTHAIPRKREPKRTWHFSADFQNPTFTPSINESVNQPDFEGYNPEIPSSRCHFIIREGKITYVGDSSHNLAGQELELEPWSEEEIALHQESK